MKQMRNKWIVLLFSLLFLVVACSTVPLTGRKRFLMVPESQILETSALQYHSFIQKAPLSNNRVGMERVVNVGKRIAAATEAYLRSIKLDDDVKNLKWEFNLVHDPQVNAFCMPGGKIVVYEGLLPLASTDAELAVVIGHEVAHAVAKHGNERMSNQMLAQAGGVVLGVVVSDKDPLIREAANLVYGLGTQVGVMLPYSRKHEYEADRIGLILMSMAGYNPESAVGFWQKMSANKGAGRAEIFSTHPTDANRILAIQRALPEARKYFRKW